MDQVPQTPTQPQATQPASPVMPQSFNWARTVGLSLGVLLAGLAIAYGGFYLGQQGTKSTPTPQPMPITVSPTTPPVSPTASPTATLHYANTAYGYSLDYPADLKVLGEGLQVTNETAPDVTFTTDITKATPNPLRVFHVTVQDKSLLTVNKQPISSYTPLELATMDLQATVGNKNIYVATLSPVIKLQPLPKNINGGYTFSVRSKGYQTVSNGVLWDLGDYVVTEFDSAKYHYIIVYSATDEMRQVVQTMQFTK